MRVETRNSLRSIVKDKVGKILAILKVGKKKELGLVAFFGSVEQGLNAAFCFCFRDTSVIIVDERVFVIGMRNNFGALSIRLSHHPGRNVFLKLIIGQGITKPAKVLGFVGLIVEIVGIVLEAFFT